MISLLYVLRIGKLIRKIPVESCPEISVPQKVSIIGKHFGTFGDSFIIWGMELNIKENVFRLHGKIPVSTINDWSILLVEVNGMVIIDTKILKRERDSLNVTARDLNELDNPLENILMDVMFEHFYDRIERKGNN